VIDILTDRPWARALLASFSSVVLCLVAGKVVTRYPAVDLLAFTGAILVAIFAWNRPDLFGVVLVAMLLVPYTWSPTLRSSPAPLIVLFALPGAIVGAVRLMLRGGLRLCVLDYLIVGIFASVILSEVETSSGGVLGIHTLSRTQATAILLPYVAFRLILAAWPQIIPKLPNVFILVGVGLSLFAIWEELRGSTPFATSSLNNPLLAEWERNYPRAGGVRAQATMGHPIALGSFLVIPLVFAFAQRRWRLFALLGLGEALTLSRGPYIAAIAAVLLYSILTRRVGRFLIAIAVAGTFALSIGPVGSSITNSFEAGTAEQMNANYRSTLLTTSITDLTLWGHPASPSHELYNNGPINLGDVTSEFALLPGEQGALGLLIWVGLIAAFMYTIREARRRKDSLLLMLGVALVGEWIGLLSVALITTFADAFLLTVALAATRLASPFKSATFGPEAAG
jgi:hypothetical protein